ncbi:hypothetical protein HOF56_03085 [Candidatus Peribacteria bacterium]|nr:hypothetical protein [Candidatus Peribacteria bacterium]MBT4240917.1 hypothetical protein [Candidatus Peribacteria bacterium]MBT4474560.1 hypothetical protein [Candidatus Peribacteria bacterium]
MSQFSQHEVYERHRHIRRGSSRGKSIGIFIKRIIGWILMQIVKLIKWFKSSRSKEELFKRVFKFVFISGSLFAGFIFVWLLFIYLTLPNVDEVGALFAAESTVITDRHGEELYRIHGDEDRTFVPLSYISDFAKQATIAIEDERFYERGCFDPRAFTRAVIRNLIGGFGSQGGSTITQQFAKNAIIGSRKKRVTRKLKEYMLSCKLEDKYSKDEVLELYLNRIPYGHNAHGIEQASKIYFAKSSSGLTLAEASVLAALPQLPSYLNPYGKHVRTTLSEGGKDRMIRGKIKSSRDIKDEDFWLGLAGENFDLETGEPLGPDAGTGNVLYIGGRTDQVLRNMQDQGFISNEDRESALFDLQNIAFKRARENIRAPHFVLFVREEIKKMLAGQFDEGFLERGGLKVITTLDYNLQEIAESIVTEIGDLNIDLYGAYNAALLAMDPWKGEVLAYVGNRDYWDEENDGNVDIIRAPRQPGSSFKPFSYAASFLNGFNPATVLYDVPTKIGEDEPENFDSKFFGPMTIRDALGASRNIPAAKSYFMAGREDSIVNLAADMGIPTVRDRRDELSEARGSEYKYGWPLSLGAAEIPLFELAQGYSTFAREGKALDPTYLLRIEDRHGNILYEATEEKEERDVLDPRVSYMITSILSDESARPEEYWRQQLSIPGYETAAKTGTSNKCSKRDNKEIEDGHGRCLESAPDNTWTIGYTPFLVAGAWGGNASGGTLFAKASGLNTASPIWRRFMIAAHKKINKEGVSVNDDGKFSFEIPDELESAQISKLSGKLASKCTPVEYRKADIFMKGEAPKEFDTACVESEIDKLTGLIASDECPQEAREQGSFFDPKSIMPTRWHTWEKDVQNWAKDVSAGTGSSYWIETQNEDGEISKKFRGTGAFLPLPLPLFPDDKCTLDITPGRLIKPSVRIKFPSNNGLAALPSFIPKIDYTVGHQVRDVRYELDGRLVSFAASGSNLMPRIRISRRMDTSGSHTLKVTLTDSYYNTASHAVKFRFEEGENTSRNNRR